MVNPFRKLFTENFLVRNKRDPVINPFNMHIVEKWTDIF